MVSKLGRTNTMMGLLFPGMVSAFGTFLLRQAYMGLPKELEEAARLQPPVANYNDKKKTTGIEKTPVVFVCTSHVRMQGAPGHRNSGSESLRGLRKSSLPAESI